MTVAAPTTRTSPRRMVRFVKECEHQVFLLEADAEADAVRTLAPEDYTHRKERRKQEAEECRKKGYGILLMDSFEDPVSHVQNHITVFAQLPDPCCGRGLERQVSRKHDWERREWRTKCVQNVLAEECKLRYQGGWNDQDAIWETLATVSKKASRSAKRFARRIGKADEYVVQEGELEDLDPALTLINEIKALQIMRNFQTAKSLSVGGEHELCLTSPIRSFGRRASYSGGDSISKSMDAIGMNQSVRSLSCSSSRSKRRAMKKAASDRALDIRRARKASLDTDSGSLRSKKSTKSSSSSYQKPSFLKRWSSFKKLGGSQRGMDTSPESPSRPKLLPSTSWRSSPKLTTSVSSTKASPPPPPVSEQSPGRRSVLQRWNSWSITSPSTSVNGKPGSQESTSICKSLSDHERKTETEIHVPAQVDDDEGEEGEDLYGANTDFDDSIVFNRRRRRASKRRAPALATLEEGDYSYSSYNDSSTNNNGSSATFFAKWGHGQHQRKKFEETPADFNASNCSLNLTDIGLPPVPGDQVDEVDHDDDSEESKREITSTPPRRRGEDSVPTRRGEDNRPKAPPSTRWSSSASAPTLPSMPEDECDIQSPKECTPLNFGTPGSKERSFKRAQLLKAEQWAANKSTPALITVDENAQTTPQLEEQPTLTREEGNPSKRRNSMSDLPAVPQEEQVTEKSPKKGGKLRKFLKRWSSSSKLTRGENTTNDTNTKTNKRRLLTRWGSSSFFSKREAVIVEEPRSEADAVVVEAPAASPRTQMLTRHSSTPALFPREAATRKAPERTPSNSTVDSHSDYEHESPQAQLGRRSPNRSWSRHSRSTRTIEF